MITEWTPKQMGRPLNGVWEAILHDCKTDADLVAIKRSITSELNLRRYERRVRQEAILKAKREATEAKA